MERIASILFAFSVAAHSANFSMVVYSNVKEIEIRRQYTRQKVEPLLFAPEFLKVGTHMQFIGSLD